MTTLRQRRPESLVVESNLYNDHPRNKESSPKYGYGPRSPRRTSRKLWQLASLVAFLPWIIVIFQKIKYEKLLSTALEIRNQYHSAQRQNRWAKQRLEKLRQEVKEAADAKIELLRELRRHGDNLNMSQGFEEHQELEGHYLERLDQLQESVTLLNKRSLRKLPSNRVQVTLNQKEESLSFVLELNTARAPHAAAQFLEWDYTNMTLVHKYHSQIHVVPMMANGTHDSDRLEKQELLFIEPVETTPGAYRICFAEMGPYWYLATTAVVDARNEVCFGTVVDGVEKLRVVFKDTERHALTMATIAAIEVVS